MTTPRKLTIAAVALLVCGVVVALMARKPSPELVLTLTGFETNHGRVSAGISVSNASSRVLSYLISSESEIKMVSGERRTMTMISMDSKGTTSHPSYGCQSYTVSVPEERPWRVRVVVGRDYSSTIFRRARYYFDVHVRRDRQLSDAYTLEFAE